MLESTLTEIDASQIHDKTNKIQEALGVKETIVRPSHNLSAYGVTSAAGERLWLSNNGVKKYTEVTKRIVIPFIRKQIIIPLRTIESDATEGEWETAFNHRLQLAVDRKKLLEKKTDEVIGRLGLPKK